MIQNESFSAEAKRIMLFAETEARAAHCSYVGTEHFLLACYREEVSGGNARAALNLRAIDLHSVREAIRQFAIPGAKETAHAAPVNLPLSPNLRCTIEAAQRRKQQTSSGEISSLHLIFALLQQKESTAYLVLKDLGFFRTPVPA